MKKSIRKKYQEIKNKFRSKKVISMIIIIIFMIILLFIGVSIYNNNLDEKSIDINGIKKLENLDVNNYDVKALSLDLKEDEIITVPISYNYNSSSIMFDSYYLTSDTKYYKKVVTNSVNDDGEIFSTIDYTILTIEDLEKILSADEEGILTYLWADTSKNCSAILISYE